MEHTGFDNNKNPFRISLYMTLLSFFRLKSIVPLLIGLSFFYLIFYTSCANIGSPTGGPKDSIPPVVLKTIPDLRSTGFKGSDVRFTFDEYIIPDEITDKLVISPPMKKKPIIKMKGKTLIVEFSEDLRKDATYSLDFKDAVADNNEKNPIEDLRFSFSTGSVFDSLRIAGFVKKALSQEPVEKALVLLHRKHEYTAFIDSIPDYIGTTNKEGFFMIDNVARGEYRLYALTDADNSLTYNSNAELIAFADTILVPSAKYIAEVDTIVKGLDTMVVSGYTDYSPATQYLMMFEEEKFDQYLDASKRTQANKCDFYFSESLSDSFRINLLKPTTDKDWSFLEANLKRDSITVWLTDTIISNSDSLKFELKYEVLDSLNQLVIKQDTVELIYTAPKAPKQKKKKDDVPVLPTINLSNNINSSAHDLYQRIRIEAPEPLTSFDLSKISLFSVVDTVKTMIPIVVEKDTNSIRKYYIEYDWEPNSSYLFRIDSAAARNIYGHPNNKTDQKFRTQKEDYYGRIYLTISGLSGPAIVQLLANDKEERILQKIQVFGDGKIEFPYLKPEKYIIRLMMDPNKNGKWDTGFLSGNIQPERVVYYPKVIKVRSNFDIKENWEINYKPDYKKELIDEEAEKEKARKKEQAKKAGTKSGE
ncbi:MAG: Ig-like domain-containing protein [Prolixibacteraceae bacterium]|nr:Ig-like domain-containing protein [Prolixibacteraceae bacterium]